MRYVVVGPHAICAIGPFDSKQEARQYIEDHMKGVTAFPLSLLPPKPPENGQLFP